MGMETIITVRGKLSLEESTRYPMGMETLGFMASFFILNLSTRYPMGMETGLGRKSRRHPQQRRRDTQWEWKPLRTNISLRRQQVDEIPNGNGNYKTVRHPPQLLYPSTRYPMGMETLCSIFRIQSSNLMSTRYPMGMETLCSGIHNKRR